MKKYIFIVITFFLFFLSCKKNEINNSISQIQKTDEINIVTEQKSDIKEDTVLGNKSKESNQKGLIDLPFDFEEKNKLANQDEIKFREFYPTLKDDKFEDIKKIIFSNNEDNPDDIFQINNGGLNFETYVYCTYGDSDSQTLINVKNGKIISDESIGYAMPENETYQSFVINRDLSIVVNDINYNTRVKKVLEKYQIKNDGSIIKIK